MSTRTQQPASQPIQPRERGGIEVRSIDHVPNRERHGTVWPVAAIWVAGNASVGTLAVGTVGVLAGAGLFWTMVAMVLGCCFGTVFSALHSTQGPHLGLPQLIQSRPQFGYRGAVVVFALALINYVGFNVFVFILGGESLHVTAHVPDKPSYVLIGVLTGVLALVGYNWIHHVSRWLSIAFVLVFSVVTVVILASGAIPANAFAPGHFRLTAFLLQFAAAAGYQINWAIYVSDYTRYLPRTVSGHQMFWCTYLGMTISAAWLGCLGAMIALVFPKLDSVTGSQAAGDLLFHGFGAIAILVGLVGLITVGAMNAYGGAMALISTADCFARISFTRALRVITVSLVTIGAIVLSLAASSNFLTTFSAFLTVLLYLFAPWTAINLTDYFIIRKGRYSILDMFNPRGMYGIWNAKGLLTYAIGILAEIPFATTTWYQGPLSKALKGIDITPFVGLAIAFVVYFALHARHDQATEVAQIQLADADLDA